MARRLSNADLLSVSKGQAKTINNFRVGVRLTTVSGRSIDELTALACTDRFNFAKQVLQCARWASLPPKPQYRVVLARAYYAMYHAARAVVYFVDGGDDNEAHSELPKHIPKDFPDRDRWENEIKNARYERNRADYDPYPKSDKTYARVAQATLKTAEDFLSIARRYLIRKGCSL